MMGPEAQSKAKGEMKEPTHSQGKSSAPQEENGNSDLIYFLRLDKECKIL